MDRMGLGVWSWSVINSSPALCFVSPRAASPVGCSAQNSEASPKTFTPVAFKAGSLPSPNSQVSHHRALLFWIFVVRYSDLGVLNSFQDRSQMGGGFMAFLLHSLLG